MTLDGDARAPREPASNRRTDIQGLRAVAVIMVVAFHAGLAIPGGFTGVDVFFVISGFVITAMLLREVGTSGGLSFKGFYARRVRRILPASALTISVVALASIAAISPSAQETTARTGVAGSLFVSNLLLARQRNGYFDVAATSNPLLHIWSLSVEEQFYIVFPALLVLGFFLARRRFPQTDPRRVIGTIVGVVAVVSFILSWYATTHTFPIDASSSAWIRALFPGRTLVQTAFYLAPTRAWEFAVGALLALGVPHISRLPRVIALWSGVLGAVIVAWGAFAISDSTPFPGTAALLPVVGTGLLIIAGTVAPNRVSSLLSLRPMTWVGDLSYSWYLWHWPLIVFAGALFPMEDNVALIGAAISVLPAWWSFKYVETPLRRDTRVRGRRAVAVALVCIVVPIAACVVLLRAPKPPRSEATAALLTSVGGHADQLRGCNRGLAPAAQPSACTWRVPSPRGTVVLLGDSNAGHFAEPAAAASNGLGLNFTASTFPECPMVDLIITNPRSPALRGRCRHFVTATLRQLTAARPNLVILAASGPLSINSRTSFRDPISGVQASSPRAKARLWSGGLGRVLERLARADIPTVVIHTVPQWGTWDLRACAEARVYLAPQSCGADQTRAEVAAFRQRSLDAENRALRTVPTATGVDFIAELCGANRCATNRGNQWLYRDGRHLSVYGSRTLTHRFIEIIREHVRQ